MMLAQRYPDAYHGIHACAPAVHWNEVLASTTWPQLIMEWVEYFPYPCELNELVAAAIEACDKNDGVEDGIISDDSACDFDPRSQVGKTFFCADTNSTMVISGEVATIARATWTGPQTVDEQFVWYGPNTGSQLGGSTTALTNDIGPAMTSCSNNGTCVGVPLGLGEVWLKYFVENNVNWNWREMTHAEFDNNIAKAIERYDAVIGTNDPDLTSFFEKGGKILGYHGMVSGHLC